MHRCPQCCKGAARECVNGTEAVHRILELLEKQHVGLVVAEKELKGEVHLEQAWSMGSMGHTHTLMVQNQRHKDRGNDCGTVVSPDRIILIFFSLSESAFCSAVTLSTYSP